MKTQIRRSVFETNSSSTHSISIVREPTNIHFPTTLEFNVGEFGWEWKTYSDYLSKASYLYTAILYNTYLESNTELIDGKQKCRAMVNEKLNKINDYDNLENYLNKECAYDCRYFVLERIYENN